MGNCDLDLWCHRNQQTWTAHRLTDSGCWKLRDELVLWQESRVVSPDVITHKENINFCFNFRTKWCLGLKSVLNHLDRFHQLSLFLLTALNIWLFCHSGSVTWRREGEVKKEECLWMHFAFFMWIIVKYPLKYYLSGKGKMLFV